MTTTQARALRRRMTDAESTLWSRLRMKQLNGAKFRRQQPIGPCIADFVSFEHALIVEIGGAHSRVERTRSTRL